MTDFDQEKMTEYAKQEIKNEIESITNEEFGQAYNNGHGLPKSFSRAIDRQSVEESVAIQFNEPDDGSTMPQIAAMVDAIFESDWFYDYIIGEKDNRIGEINKRQTDERAYYAEISRHVN